MDRQIKYGPWHSILAKAKEPSVIPEFFKGSLLAVGGVKAIFSGWEMPRKEQSGIRSVSPDK
jgi:hypothetical protein